jgi:DNA-binding NarL/FixJ family response regulator
MGPEGGHTLEIVLVEDDDDMRTLVRTFLTMDGRFDVVGEASDGSRAIQLASQLQPDAIVLDVSMPVMDGSTALPFLRSAAPGVTVVIFSALAPQDPRLVEARAAADGYVRKDEFGMLSDVLHRAFLSRRRHGSLAESARPSS